MSKKYAVNRAYITVRSALVDTLGWIDGVQMTLDGHIYTDNEKWLAEGEFPSRREKILAALKRADKELEEARLEEARKAA